jgi:hypothetical protein
VQATSQKAGIFPQQNPTFQRFICLHGIAEPIKKGP